MIQSTVYLIAPSFFYLIIHKKFAIHLTEKEERGLCFFL